MAGPLIYKKGLLGGEFSPLDVSGCILWLDFSDSSTMSLTGSDIVSISDKSGVQNDFVTTANTIFRPVLKSNEKNGLSVADFTNATKPSGASVFNNSIQSAFDDCFEFMVFELRTASQTNDFHDYNGSGSRFLFRRNSNNTMRIFQTVNFNTTATYTTGYYIAANKWDGANSSMSFNGSTPVTGNVGTKSNVTTMIISPAFAYVAEFLIYPVDITANDISNILTYLNTKWAIY